MALVTAGQFDLVPRAGALGQGIIQGQQIAAGRQAAAQTQAAAQRQQQLGQFSQQALTGDAQALGSIAQIDPQKARNIQQFLASQTESERTETLRENEVLTKNALIARSLEPGQIRPFLEQQRNLAEREGRSTERVDRALSGSDDQLRQDIEFQAREGQTIKQLADAQFPGSTRKIAPTASQRDFEAFEELKAVATESGLEKDIERAAQFGRQAGFVRETVQEKEDIKTDARAKREVDKANIKRKQGFIDTGVQAADSSINLRRSLELIDTVATGGFDAFALRAKQVFGVEGANELELTTNLGKNVLAQLRPIFGAAFTAAEGESLKRIEAGFGRSTAGNKRLLERTLKIADRAARRGIAAAEAQNDEFAANEIRGSLEFNFDTEEAAEAPGAAPQAPQAPQAPEPALQAPAPQAPQATQFTEGQTATNPQTGQKLVFRNGQWSSL